MWNFLKSTFSNPTQSHESGALSTQAKSSNAVRKVIAHDGSSPTLPEVYARDTSDVRFHTENLGGVKEYHEAKTKTTMLGYVDKKLQQNTMIVAEKTRMAIQARREQEQARARNSSYKPSEQSSGEVA